MTEATNSVRVDAGNLAVYDTGNILTPSEVKLGGNLFEHTSKVVPAIEKYVRHLIDALRSCQQENTDSGTVLTLPAPKTLLPREKPMPSKSKFETSWEKFRKKKGIRNHGRQLNKEYDEDTKEWKDKWGKRAREHERRYDWIREVGENYAPNADGGDPFLDSKNERAARKRKIAKKVSKNERKRDNFENSGVSSNNAKGKKKLRIGHGTKDSAKLKSLAKLHGQVATASMGKFDRVRKRV
mmetsp:Transcript_8467/g.12804  ORF Transcript_8467/g.12804 Transcript_8467/m.12804 type:complete len:240 (-) Transcript_8467:14-733(-)